MKQHWHERFQQDPANRWLRSLIADLFLDVRPANAGARSAPRKAR
jgi:hypothetical protein